MTALRAARYPGRNTVTRMCFMRRRRPTQEALAGGSFTTQLEKASLCRSSL